MSAPAAAGGAAPGARRPLSHRTLSTLVIAFAAGLVVMVWVAVGLSLDQKRRDALSAETRQNANLASVLGEQTLRVIAAVDQSMLRVRDGFAGDAGPPPDLVTLARETGLTPGILAQLSLVDARGRFVGSNLDPSGEKSGHVDLSAREHVRVHLAPGTPGSAQIGANGMFVGRPVLGKVSGRWTIQLSRRLGDPSGPPRGVVVASVNPSYFEDVYTRVDLGRSSAVALVGEDLTVRARVLDGRPSGMGTELPPTSAFATHLGGRKAEFVARSSVDGVERIIAMHRVADYPLQVVVSTSVETALAGWRQTRAVLAWMAGAMTLVVLAATAGLVTGLRRLQAAAEALAASEAEAQAASDAKSAFLAAISHELRTPLTSIRGFAELMEHRLEPPTFRLQAGLIRKGAEHLNQLLTEILDLSKIEAGAMEVNPEPQDLRAILQGTVDFFALSAGEKRLALRAEVAPDVPALVPCDGLRLKQILNNLVSNAVKFTPAGEVRLLARHDAANRTLLLDVEDTGPGIPPEMAEAVFQKFRQGSARTSYEHGGTGLGLALSRSLAELMHGRLTLSTPPGGGARFTLALPIGEVVGRTATATQTETAMPDRTPAKC